MEIDSNNTIANHPHNHKGEKLKYEVADIFDCYLTDYLMNHTLSLYQYNIVRDILACRTSELGFHKLTCDICDYEQIEYNSCRNRHCPKRQGAKRIRWVNSRLKELLPICYYHAVFTLPHSLNLLALYNKEVIYDIFMKSTALCLKDFALDPKYLGVKIGFVGLLHTWGQPLSQHIPFIIHNIFKEIRIT